MRFVWSLLNICMCVSCTRDHILAEDLEHFLNAKHAAEAFDMLDDDKDGKASLKDVRAAVCTIFRCCLLFAYAPPCFSLRERQRAWQYCSCLTCLVASMLDITHHCIYGCPS